MCSDSISYDLVLITYKLKLFALLTVVPPTKSDTLQPASSTLRGMINTKCDCTPPRPRAAGEGKHSAALKQNQIVEIWEVLLSQHLVCTGPTPV